MSKINVLKNNQKHIKDLVTALDEISVIEVDEMPKPDISGWYGVADTDGVNAFFSTPQEALSYRLFLINRILND